MFIGDCLTQHNIYVAMGKDGHNGGRVDPEHDEL